jgi:hypothetical protein
MKFRALSDREIAVTPGLAAAYAAVLAGLKVTAGECAGSEPIVAMSAMEGKFTWTCSHGRIDGSAPRPWR